MLDTIGQLIPAHVASRTWISQRGESNGEIITPAAKVRCTLLLALRHYRLSMVDYVPNTQWTRETRFRVPPHICPMCEAQFVAHSNVICCSISCGAKYRRAKGYTGPQAMKLVEHESTPTGATGGLTPRHPELVAMETIYDALFPLDEAARARVLAYAEHMIKALNAPPPVLYLVDNSP